MKYEEIEWPLVYDLENPVTLKKSRSDDEVIDQLEFREPQLGDLGDVKIGEPLPLSSVQKIGAALTGQKLLTMRKLRGEDAAMLVTVVFGFFAKCQSGISAD